MYAEILLNGQAAVDVDCLVAKRTHIDFLVFLFVLTAAMRLYRRVLGTVDLFAVLALDWKPVFLTTGVESAKFSNVLVEHFENFLRL